MRFESVRETCRVIVLSGVNAALANCVLHSQRGPRLPVATSTVRTQNGGSGKLTRGRAPTSTSVLPSGDAATEVIT